MDTEQQKHHRRLAYFHERLTAKNAEYAELEQQLTQSEPTSPVQEQHGKAIAPENMAASLDRKMTMLMMEENKANEVITPTRWRRSASLDATATVSPYPMKRPIIMAPIAQPHDLNLETALHRLSPSKSRHNHNTLDNSAALSFKDELYAQELQDMTLRHQASVDNMISEYEENRMELLAQHAREKEVWKIEHEVELQETCTKLSQEHSTILDEMNQSWQKKWDDLVAQTERDQCIQKQQWIQQFESAKLEWETRHAKENADLRKQLSWSKGELHMVG